MLRVDVNGDTEGVITETATQAIFIGITTGHSDTVAEHLVDRPPIRYQFPQCRFNRRCHDMTDQEWLNAGQPDLHLILSADAAAGKPVNLIDTQFAIGLADLLVINRTFLQGAPLVAVVTAWLLLCSQAATDTQQ